MQTGCWRIMRMADAVAWLARIHALKLAQPVRVLNVCGGHERTISLAGIRGVLPEAITLVPGPGCPVCVCPEADILGAIALAAKPGMILAAFGDMLRVPANVARGEVRSLTEARARGADVRAVAAPGEAVMLARANPERSVVFFAAGFETTAAPIAAMLNEALPDNFSVLLSARRTWPAVAMLLGGPTQHFEALIAPGHVATIMGAAEWRFVPERHGIATAVAGFTAVSLLAAIYAVLLQVIEGRPALENAYPECVRPAGNLRARDCIAGAFADVDANWRGIGTIAKSGFALRPHLAAHDARQNFPATLRVAKSRMGDMPPGCDCAGVVMGRLQPVDCRLFGKACTPRMPVGPCMVSDEGACRIWWSSGQRGDASRAA
jgi:hydrogenase expression/formation protein HypD